MPRLLHHRLGWKVLPTKKHYDLYDEFIEALTPDIVDNVVQFLDIAIFGKPGCGKTTNEKRIAEIVVEHYGEENVNCLISQSFKALTEKLDDKPVQVLIVDDPLRKYHSRGGKQRSVRDAIADFVEIRHKLELKVQNDIAKHKKGVGDRTSAFIITIFGSQIHSGLDKTFREGTIQIFKTSMAEDRRSIMKSLGYKKSLYAALEEITRKIYVQHKHEARSEVVCSIAFGANVGKMRLEMPRKDYCIWVYEEMKDEIKTHMEWEKVINEIANYVIAETSIDPFDRSSGRLIRAEIRKQYPQLWVKLNEENKIRDILDECAHMANRIIEEAKEEEWNDMNYVNQMPEDHFKYDEWERLLYAVTKGRHTIGKGLNIEACTLYLIRKDLERVLPYLYDEILNLTSKGIRHQSALKKIKDNMKPSGEGYSISLSSLASAVGKTQPALSKLFKRNVKIIEGVLNEDKGRQFEIWTEKQLKAGKSLCYMIDEEELILLDGSDVTFIERDGKHGKADIIVYDGDGYKTIISCKVTQATGKFAVKTKIAKANYPSMKPEYEEYVKALKEDKKSRIILLVKNDSSLNYLTARVFTSEVPNEIWEHMCLKEKDFKDEVLITKAKVNKGELPNLYWKRDDNVQAEAEQQEEVSLQLEIEE